MRLTDIMSNARLEIFAEIGLVMFALIFAGVLIYTFSRRNKASFERARQLPLVETNEEEDRHDQE